MPTAALADIPRVAWAFIALRLALLVYSFSLPHHLPHRLGVAVGVACAVLVVNLLWLGAMLIWRQPWAWWLYLVGGVWTTVQRLFAMHDTGAVALLVANLVLIGLLASPGMRRYVGVRWPGQAAPAT